MESEKLYFVARVQLISGLEHYTQISGKITNKIDAELCLLEWKQNFPFHDFVLLSIEE